ncbi:MAG: IS1380 family transposase [Gammaproteobacteria bacterium]|nr:IS1380 family transposase [Gammaproteobacteria bacterium]
MKILPYQLETTNDLLTSRAGLLSIAELMNSLGLGDRINTCFPQPGSNRGFKPSVFMETLILMQHEGGFHLDDVRHLREDRALGTVLGLEQIPQAASLGNWLRRMGKHPEWSTVLNQVNQTVLQATLHHRKAITLDIDATEIIASKADAHWTYKNNRGYMPMVGHIAETGQIVACDFREGNTPPAKDNLNFIRQCQDSLPAGCYVQKLRIDAAGYQTNIIKHCDQQQIDYAIRAKMSAYLKEVILDAPENDWHPLLSRKGGAMPGHSTYRTVHFMGDYEQAFTVVVQRKELKGQVDLEVLQSDEEVCAQGFVYRAIATNRETMTDSEIIHWYNQRGEDSENRIKELKLDFGGDTLPCSDFDANAVYFSVCALAYNLFALMRQLLPEDMECHRANTIRWRLYAMAAKVVKTGRQVFVKVQAQHQALLDQVLAAMREFEPLLG